jgi:hypothetical protein
MNGTANMSSEIKGAAAVIRREPPRALYFQCLMHCLNSCAAGCVKVPPIRNCLEVLIEIINFFAYSATRNYLLQKTTEETQHNSKSLKKLCEIRLVEKHRSVVTISQLLPSLKLAMERLAASDSQKNSTKSSSASVFHWKSCISCESLVTDRDKWASH